MKVVDPCERGGIIAAGPIPTMLGHATAAPDRVGTRLMQLFLASNPTCEVESRRSAVACRAGGAYGAQRLSLPRSPRSPSLRLSFPLIELGVRISHTQLSDGFHVKACAAANRAESPVGSCLAF